MAENLLELSDIMFGVSQEVGCERVPDYVTCSKIGKSCLLNVAVELDTVLAGFNFLPFAVLGADSWKQIV